MDFEFSTDVVPLWPWQYHQYEPPGAANHNDLYYCSAVNRCNSCKTQVHARETAPGNPGITRRTVGNLTEEALQKALDTDENCRVYMNQRCLICSTVTDQLVSVIQWVNNGDSQFNDHDIPIPVTTSNSKDENETHFPSYISSTDVLSSTSRVSPITSKSSVASYHSEFEPNRSSGKSKPLREIRLEESEARRSNLRSASSEPEIQSEQFKQDRVRPRGTSDDDSYRKSCSASVTKSNRNHNRSVNKHEIPPVETFEDQTQQLYAPLHNLHSPLKHWSRASRAPAGSSSGFFSMTAEQNYPNLMHWSSSPPTETYSQINTAESTYVVPGENIQNRSHSQFIAGTANSITAHRKSSSAPAGHTPVLSPPKYFQLQCHEFPLIGSTFSSVVRRNLNTFPLFHQSRGCKKKNNHGGSNNLSPPFVHPDSSSVQRLTENSATTKLGGQDKSSSKVVKSSRIKRSASELFANTGNGSQSTSRGGKGKTKPWQTSAGKVDYPAQRMKSSVSLRNDIEENKIESGVSKTAPFTLGFPPNVAANPEGHFEVLQDGLAHVAEKVEDIVVAIKTEQIEEKNLSEEFVRSNYETDMNCSKSSTSTKTSNNGMKKKKKSAGKCCGVGSRQDFVKAPANANRPEGSTTEKGPPDIIHSNAAVNKQKQSNPTNKPKKGPLKLRELNPDLRTPRAMRLRALQACKLNLKSAITEESDSDFEAGIPSTTELSPEDSAGSTDGLPEASKRNVKNSANHGPQNIQCSEIRRVKRKKKNIRESRRDDMKLREVASQTFSK